MTMLTTPVITKEKPYIFYSLTRVFNAAFEITGEDLGDLIGTSKQKSIVHSRMMIVGAIRELTQASLPEISRMFGKRHHSTIHQMAERFREIDAEERSVWISAVRARVKQTVMEGNSQPKLEKVR